MPDGKIGHAAERERDRERQRETERDRERQRETERDRERQRERERERETERKKLEKKQRLEEHHWIAWILGPWALTGGHAQLPLRVFVWAEAPIFKSDSHCNLRAWWGALQSSHCARLEGELLLFLDLSAALQFRDKEGTQGSKRDGWRTHRIVRQRRASAWRPAGSRWHSTSCNHF